MGDTPTTPQSNALNDAGVKLGLTPEELAVIIAASNSSSSSSEPTQQELLYGSSTSKIKVQYGRATKTKYTQRAGTPTVTAGQRTPLEYYEPSKVVEKLYNDPATILGSLYTLTPEQRTALQQKLFAAGFYGNTKLANVKFGEPDELTEGAFSDLLIRTAKMNAAGQDVTWEEVLANLSGSEAAAKRLADALSDGGGGSGATINYYDPVYLAKTIDDAAVSVLGRQATTDEERLFTAALHSLQASSTSTIISPPASAEDFLRTNMAVESTSHDLAKTFGSFIKLLGGIAS